MRRKLINVTAEDIKRGERGMCYRCPVARAIQRITGRLASVGYAQIGILKDFKDNYAHDFNIKTPTSVQDFVVQFDATPSKVKPFKFYLNLQTAQYNKLIKGKKIPA